MRPTYNLPPLLIAKNGRIWRLECIAALTSRQHRYVFTPPVDRHFCLTKLYVCYFKSGMKPCTHLQQTPLTSWWQAIEQTVNLILDRIQGAKNSRAILIERTVEADQTCGDVLQSLHSLFVF